MHAQKSTRRLHVSSQGDPWKKTEQPMIRFGGRWLREAGFNPQQPYTVEFPRPGVLTITARTGE